MMMRRYFVSFFLILSPLLLAGQPKKVLFDNTKAETAGNADWIIDTDQPIPLPAQSGITPSTAESYWLGAISAWGVDLVKQGYIVHTLTSTNGITYGNGSNPYDLSNYSLFIVCEPNTRFNASEIQAILSYVNAGGGLLMVADHDGADRNGDGWDAPKIWNDLGSDTYFGIHFQSTGESNNYFSQVGANLGTLQGDSILVGVAGAVTGLSYHGGTSMNLLTGNNANAAGHVWMNAASRGSTQVMAATSMYGRGRIGAVGDSSPADDGSAQPGNTNIFNGWTESGTGASDNVLFLNMSVWLANGGETVFPPGLVGLVQPSDNTMNLLPPANLQWHTLSGVLAYQLDISSAIDFTVPFLSDSALTDSSRSVSGLAAGTRYFWRVRAKNAGGWGGFGAVWSFTTLDVPPPPVLLSPSYDSSNLPLSMALVWGLNPAAASYELDLSTSPIFSTFVLQDSTLIDTSAQLTGLALNTTYYWRVRGKNQAGWGSYSLTFRFTTWDLPARVELKGPADSAVVTGDPLRFSWHRASAASLYQFDLSLSSAFDPLVVTDSSLTDTLRPVSGLDTGVVYYWRVRGWSEAGWGQFSPTWKVTHSLFETIAIALRDGWNLVSLPLQVNDGRRSVLYPGSTSNAYLFDGGYSPRETLQPGPGYWIKSGGSRSIDLTGIPVVADTIPVVAGWNLIGAVSSPVPASGLSSNPPGIIGSRIYGFASGYALADTLVPGMGYWVKTNQAGFLINPGSASASRDKAPHTERMLPPFHR